MSNVNKEDYQKYRKLLKNKKVCKNKKLKK